MYHSNHPSSKEASKFVKTDGLNVTIVSFEGKVPSVKRYDLNFSSEIPLFPMYSIMPSTYYEKYVNAERAINVSQELFEV